MGTASMKGKLSKKTFGLVQARHDKGKMSDNKRFKQWNWWLGRPEQDTGQIDLNKSGFEGSVCTGGIHARQRKMKKLIVSGPSPEPNTGYKQT